LKGRDIISSVPPNRTHCMAILCDLRILVSNKKDAWTNADGGGITPSLLSSCLGLLRKISKQMGKHNSASSLGRYGIYKGTEGKEVVELVFFEAVSFEAVSFVVVSVVVVSFVSFVALFLDPVVM